MKTFIVVIILLNGFAISSAHAEESFQIYRLRKGTYPIETNNFRTFIPARCIQKNNNPLQEYDQIADIKGEFRIYRYKARGSSERTEVGYANQLTFYGNGTPFGLNAGVANPELAFKYELEVTGPYILLLPFKDDAKATEIYKQTLKHLSSIEQYDQFVKKYEKTYLERFNDSLRTLRSLFQKDETNAKMRADLTRFWNYYNSRYLPLQHVEWSWLDDERASSNKRVSLEKNLFFIYAIQNLLYSELTAAEKKALRASSAAAKKEFEQQLQIQFSTVEFVYNQCLDRTAIVHIDKFVFVTAINNLLKQLKDECNANPEVKVTASKSGVEAETSFEVECGELGGSVSFNSKGEFEIGCKAGIWEISLSK